MYVALGVLLDITVAPCTQEHRHKQTYIITSNISEDPSLATQLFLAALGQGMRLSMQVIAVKVSRKNERCKWTPRLTRDLKKLNVANELPDLLLRQSGS